MTDTIESLRQQLAEVTNEKREYQLEAQGQIEFLDKKLAECQATNGKLREALDNLTQYNSSEKTVSVLTRYIRDGRQALAIPNDATALNELIAERTASLTAEVERLNTVVRSWHRANAPGGWIDDFRKQYTELTAEVEKLKDCWSAEGDQVDTLRKQNAELTAQRDGLLAALEEISDDYADRFDLGSQSTNPGIKYVVEQARAAIANCKEAGKCS